MNKRPRTGNSGLPRSLTRVRRVGAFEPVAGLRSGSLTEGDDHRANEDLTCGGCGHIRCSCPPEPPKAKEQPRPQVGDVWLCETVREAYKTECCLITRIDEGAGVVYGHGVNGLGANEISLSLRCDGSSCDSEIVAWTLLRRDNVRFDLDCGHAVSPRAAVLAGPNGKRVCSHECLDLLIPRVEDVWRCALKETPSIGSEHRVTKIDYDTVFTVSGRSHAGSVSLRPDGSHPDNCVWTLVSRRVADGQPRA